jgi:putative restriction endonuclease
MDRQRGIRKPAGSEAALAIRTTYTPPNQLPPYNDSIGPDGLQRYKYRGEDPHHPENVGCDPGLLRLQMPAGSGGR